MPVTQVDTKNISPNVAEVTEITEITENPEIKTSQPINDNKYEIIQNRTEDPKHVKYKDSYLPNEIFFGLGIENETYLLSDKYIERTGEWILNNRKRERYSVDYWTNFNKEDVINAFKMINKKKKYKIPVFINSHSFMKCDRNGQHKTNYTKMTEANTKFEGKTIHEFLLLNSEYYRKNIDLHFMYDGDTIEFTTLDFYNTTVNKCIRQLVEYKKEFLDEINKCFNEYKILKNEYNDKLFYSKNYGLVNYVTNPKNIGICNNSTYHINITLPTKLNKMRQISNLKDFHNQHSNAMRAIQWIEPMLVACYGSPDIFALGSDKFAKGSLRVALSRYIGVGTYDTDKMEMGKLLNNFEYDPSITNDNFNKNSDLSRVLAIMSMFDEKSSNDTTSRTNIEANNMLSPDIDIFADEPRMERQINKYACAKEHWYKKYHKKSGYIAQKMIGFDINYQKHYNHGIELRIFDYFPEENLVDVVNILLLVCQLSMNMDIINHHHYDCYDDQLIECIKNGYKSRVLNDYVSTLEKVFDYKGLFEMYYDGEENNKPITISQLLQKLVDKLYDDLRNASFITQISPNMDKPKVKNYNEEVYNLNKNFIENGCYHTWDNKNLNNNNTCVVQ